MDQATIVELAKGVALLLALCLIHGIIARRWNDDEAIGRILSGILFGSVCVIGMMTPIELTPGVIFDARSVVLSMSGLFGGPLVGAVAATIAGGYRLWIGGGGVGVGVSVVIACVLLGLAFRFARRRGWVRTGAVQLLAFGLLVHLVVIWLFSFLPAEVVARVMDTIALPMVLTFTPATALLGLLLLSTEQQVQTERSLAESEARFRDVAEISGDWVWEMDADLRLTFLSSRFFELFPIKPDEIIGKTRMDISQAFGDKEQWSQHYEQLRRRAPFRDFEYSVALPGQELRHVRTSGKPVFDRRGTFLGYRGTGTDVTARRAAEAAALASKKEADLANRAKSEFLANMSHELRTPLNSILGYSELLMGQFFGPLGNPKYLEYAASIHLSGTHLHNIIGDILDISKIEAGEAIVEDSVVNVEEAVRNCVAMVAVRAKEKQIEVALRIPSDLPALRADERHVKQVILNLLSNAVKFTPQGGKVAVEVCLKEGPGLEISVADNGVGIAASNIPNALRPFGQVAGSHSRGHEGTGLGLPICNSLMQLHGGTLTIDSKVGEGTRVTIRFNADRIIDGPQPHGQDLATGTR